LFLSNQNNKKKEKSFEFTPIKKRFKLIGLSFLRVGGGTFQGI